MTLLTEKVSKAGNNYISSSYRYKTNEDGSVKEYPSVRLVVEQLDKKTGSVNRAFDVTECLFQFKTLEEKYESLLKAGAVTQEEADEALEKLHFVKRELSVSLENAVEI